MMLNPMVALHGELIQLLLVSPILSLHQKCLIQQFSQRSRNKQQTCILLIFLLVSRSTLRNSTSRQRKKKLHSIVMLLKQLNVAREPAVESLFHSQICPVEEVFSTPVCFGSTANCSKVKMLNSRSKIRCVYSKDSN